MAYSYSVKKGALVGVSLIVLTCATSAAAQTPPVQPAQPANTAEASATSSVAIGDSSGTGDIVVTAQRRAETVQSVPIAITAFSQEGLHNQRIETGA